MSTLGIPSSRSKLFTPTHLIFTPHADVTIIFIELTRLNFLVWTPNSFNWVYWEIRRCASCGDVRPPDLPLSNTATTPTWRLPTVYTAKRHFHKRRLCTQLPLPQTATMLTSWPPTFLLSTSSHPMTWSVQNRNYFSYDIRINIEGIVIINFIF